jgi:hypothetical protein
MAPVSGAIFLCGKVDSKVLRLGYILGMSGAQITRITAFSTNVVSGVHSIFASEES